MWESKTHKLSNGLTTTNLLTKTSSNIWKNPFVKILNLEKKLQDGTL
jgi:hypothetical protein